MNKKLLRLIIACSMLILPAMAAEEQAPANVDPAAPVAAAATAAKKEVAKEKSEPLAISSDAIQEMDKRKVALDAREREIDEKARALDVQEKILREKLKKMEELNQKMAERLDAYKKEHEERVTKIVNVVESMKPQSAAEYVENLDPNLAVELLSRLQVTKAAKILNLVDKKKGARLSELYTGYRDTILEEKKEVPATNKAM